MTVFNKNSADLAGGAIIFTVITFEGNSTAVFSNNSAVIG